MGPQTSVDWGMFTAQQCTCAEQVKISNPLHRWLSGRCQACKALLGICNCLGDFNTEEVGLDTICVMIWKQSGVKALLWLNDDCYVPTEEVRIFFYQTLTNKLNVFYLNQNRPCTNLSSQVKMQVTRCELRILSYFASHIH